MLVSLTVGKVDAGVAVLLTEDKRLIEFPSILLPPDISSGSIVDITVARNHKSEHESARLFHSLQTSIYETFGLHTPSPPVLRCRNATQTSCVLEWDPIDLATAELRSLSLYRNNNKAGSIPKPLEMTSTKISGLAVDTEYTFHLVLRTSAGTFTSDKLVVRTHKMTDLSGITVTPGIMPSQLRESVQQSVERIGAKIIDQVRIDTTHFICTEGRGQAWERAVEMNVPVVVPDWIHGCEREGRIVGVRGYYLNADPRLRQVGPPSGTRVQPPQPSPTTQVTPPTPERPTREREEANGEHEQPDVKSPPPPPPPAKDGETEDDEDEEEDEDEAPEPKSHTDEPKARSEDVKPPAPIAKLEDDDEDDDDEEEHNAADEKAVEAGDSSDMRPDGRSAAMDEEKFDEVAL